MMAERLVTLTIISGSLAGRTFPLTKAVLVGRDDGCDIVLNDASVSTRHARIILDPSPKVSDLNSANHTYVNNEMVIDAPLRSGDVIVFGSTAARIEIRDVETEEKEKKARKRKMLLFSVIAVMVIGIGGMLFAMKRQQEIHLTQVELSATDHSLVVRFPGIMVSAFPAAADFDPATPNVSITRAISPWWTLPVMPATRGELEISRILPPDPPVREYSTTRNWTSRPPEIGARRIIRGQTLRQSLVLGNYRSVNWNYRNDDLADTEPLAFQFVLQSWDGLPVSADIAWVGLDRPAYENGVATTRPAVPRQYPILIPDNLWDTRSDSVQTAHISYSEGRRLFLHFEKKGEALYMISFDYPSHQRPRLENLAKELIAAQGLPGRTRPQTVPQMREMAELLEKQGDALVPDLSSWSFEDFERYDRKSNLFKAFARYIKALEYRQVVDDWLNNADYERLLAKTLMIHDYMQDDRSLFRRLFWQIEDGIATHRMRRAGLKEVREHLDTLHLITYEGTDLETVLTLSDGTEQKVPLLPDEWLMYTQLRNIVVRQMEGR
jgi:pSer/pThr/pTyr-binding forkhead associated (FHA) protein